MGNLAIIPARGGSKRIPRKNIRKFLGKPIIAYSIDVAIASGLFEEVMISTDDSEIAQMVVQMGARVPFIRNDKTSDDKAVLADVIDEVINTYKEENRTFENTCCILPTSPFITVEHLVSSYNKLISADLDSVFPITRFSFPIQRALRFNDDKIEMVLPEYRDTRSQDLEERFHDAGQFYWLNTERFKKNRALYTANSGAIILSEMESQDIDVETDWKLAELKYKLIQDGKEGSI